MYDNYSALVPIFLSVLLVSGCSSYLPHQAVVVQPIVSTISEPRAEDWWQTRHKEKLEQVNAAQVDLLMVGDSITHYWENAGRPVWHEYYQHRNAFNIGFSGDRTENVLWRLQDGAVDGIAPKLAVVMIGTNNTGVRMEPIAHTVEGVSAIVGELRERLPDTKILLLAIFPRHVLADDEMRVHNDQINALIADLAINERVFFLDINDLFLVDRDALNTGLMPDFLHPNEAGYRVWAEAMEPTIVELLK